ncbi:hypothetical protein CIHG_07434 [Coccidioides immitis H538.4]|uniref:Uncharacterized protein n=2 Tax=Coccidioides immitis TaxID=5501 RepID=A0A0J8UQ57_COCIT|nr:hypothetical protein CIRG_02425 [Coccidioides immitis RMSCC 2394]KMU89628.1 hypothetical protein CIHG_07434 [Coccidioides immitis H538.4]
MLEENRGSVSNGRRDEENANSAQSALDVADKARHSEYGRVYQESEMVSMTVRETTWNFPDPKLCYEMLAKFAAGVEPLRMTKVRSSLIKQLSQDIIHDELHGISDVQLSSKIERYTFMSTVMNTLQVVKH